MAGTPATNPDWRGLALALNPSPVDVPPSPLSAQVTLDQNAAATSLVPTAGGTVEAAAADGTRLSLSISADSLVEDTMVTVTPIVAVDGVGLAGGTLFGADLAPDRLRLFKLGTLTITPGTVSASTKALSFSHHAGGSEFHYSPIDVDPNHLIFHIGHFSGSTVYLGDDISIPIAPEAFQPTDWEDQINHWMQDLLRSERDRQLQGLEPDPHLNDKIFALLVEYFNRVLGTMLPRIETDCAFAEVNASKALSFDRTLELFGFGQAAMTTAISESIRKGLVNCYNEAIKPCVDRFDPAQMKRVISYARQNALVGGTELNPLDPSLACQPKTVAVAAQMHGNASGVSQDGTFVSQKTDIAFSGQGDPDGGSIQIVLGKMDLTWSYSSVDRFGVRCDGQGTLNEIELDGSCVISPDGSIRLLLSAGSGDVLPIHLPFSCGSGSVDASVQLSFDGLRPGPNPIDVTNNDLRNYIRLGPIPPDVRDAQHWDISITQKQPASAPSQ